MIDYENLSKTNKPFELEFESAFRRFLDSGWYVLGKGVTDFELEWARYCNTVHAIGVANGLDALVLSLRALELPVDSEVLVPSNTYIASILAILQAGLKPVMVEPELATYNMDPLRLPQALTSKTRAIMVVHLYGKLCKMPSIMEFADKNGLKVVEDCAQAHGANLNGKMAGSWGHISGHSFYPTKNLGALGDAGGVTSDDEQLASRVRSLRNYGSTTKYYNDRIGVNSRLDEVQALFLSIKLRRLDEINNHKRRLAEIYFNQITGGFILPVVQEGFHDVYHIFNIRHESRDSLRQHLLDKGIKTEVHYPVPPIRQKAMDGVLEGEFPIADEIHRTTLSLPISYSHTESEILQVCSALGEF